jgi:hypothetical protein
MMMRIRKIEIGQNFADDDLAPSQRCNHQLIEGARLAFARDRASHQRDGNQLQDDSDHAWQDVIDEPFLGIVENLIFDLPRRHGGDKLLAHLHRQFLGHCENLFRELVDHDVALVHLKIAQRLLEAALELFAGARVASIETKPQRNWIAIGQALAPPARDNESAPDALAKEVVFVSLPRRLFAPGESIVSAEQLDETLRPRRGILIGESSRHVLSVAGFESVPEDEREDRRENEEQNQDAAVPINMEELLVGDAPDGCDGAAVHVVFKTAS